MKIKPKSKFCMEAPNEEVEISNLNYPVMVQPKLDGFRCISIKGQLFSRTGKPFGNTSLAGYFNTLKSEIHNILDGELYAHGIPFDTLSSALRKDKAALPKNLKFYVYDTVPLDSWAKGEYKISYETRIRNVREILNDKIADYSKVIDIANTFCDNPKQILDLYNTYLQKGYEGVMLKSPDGVYQWKKATAKSETILKIKPFKSVDLKIESIHKGTGKNENKAGSVMVNFNSTPVSIGSGFDDIIREKMAREPDKYIGKTIEIKYLEVTEKGSLRHPSFQRFRPDKDV